MFYAKKVTKLPDLTVPAQLRVHLQGSQGENKILRSRSHMYSTIVKVYLLKRRIIYRDL